MPIRSISSFRLSIGAILLAAACAGSPKSGLQAGTKDVPPPPDISNIKPENHADEPKREVSSDARKDYGAAVDFYTKQTSWNESACRSAAEQFAAVARSHGDLVEAQYMVGRSYHNCGLAKEAEEAYQAALKKKPNHGASISNLGELYYQAGKIDGAKKYWESAIKANPKLSAAYVNLAMLQLEELRKMKEGDAWRKLEEDTRKKLSISLAIDNENVRAYTVYGLVYMEGSKKNRNRLDLAKLLLEEGEKRNKNFAPLQHALGLLALQRNNLTDALQRFQAAVDLDGNFAEARQNVGLISLGTRRYDVAKAQFEKVLSLQGKNYEAMIGLGIAQRGLGDLNGAEATYKKAKDLEPKRGDAYFNLGVLYKDFRASKESDLKASQTAMRTALGYFKDFLSKDAGAEEKEEAQQNIKDCEKFIKQIDDFQKAMANQPAPPPAPAGGG
ncbi:MAG TPA: tetratricopeptide repeat protein [Kofleriaceae bacterium]|jgi:tetratricopeptide (TPR) repeat protein|nr:tetratricopeptide repeat protein [Kofleriaceae bacterium]